MDSNVWERVVFPDRDSCPGSIPLLRMIKEAVQDGRVQGFICESTGTLEAIKKCERPAYFANRKPKSSIQTERVGNNTSLTITFSTDHTLHRGLHPKLIEKLQEARAMGIRLLMVPCVGLPLPGQFLDDPTFYEPLAYSSGAYFQRFGDAAAAIEARRVGSALIAAIARRIEERFPATAQTSGAGMRLLVYAEDEAERTEIAKAVAEWADGALVASHIGIENDLLCTEDRGRSAGGPSIFDATNRAWLSATYGVKFTNIPELAALLAGGLHIQPVAEREDP